MILDLLHNSLLCGQLFIVCLDSLLCIVSDCSSHPNPIFAIWCSDLLIFIVCVANCLLHLNHISSNLTLRFTIYSLFLSPSWTRGFQFKLISYYWSCYHGQLPPYLIARKNGNLQYTNSHTSQFDFCKGGWVWSYFAVMSVPISDMNSTWTQHIHRPLLQTGLDSDPIINLQKERRREVSLTIFLINRLQLWWERPGCLRDPLEY